MYVKVLVFKSRPVMWKFWLNRRGLVNVGHSFSAMCDGLYRIERRGKRELGSDPAFVRLVDPRYICLIGLCRNHLTENTVVHECVHAGQFYAKLDLTSPWDYLVGANRDEQVAYPAGRVAALVLRALRRAGLMKKEKHHGECESSEGS